MYCTRMVTWQNTREGNSKKLFQICVGKIKKTTCLAFNLYGLSSIEGSIKASRRSYKLIRKLVGDYGTFRKITRDYESF